MYVRGQYVTRNDKEATAWVRKAAEQGLPQGQYTLAAMYREGQDGLGQDDKEAVVWYCKAANQGLAEAQHDLANMYLMGRGVMQNTREALAWYNKAAEQEHVPA